MNDYHVDLSGPNTTAIPGRHHFSVTVRDALSAADAARTARREEAEARGWHPLALSVEGVRRAEERCERCGECFRDHSPAGAPSGPDGGPVCHGCRSELTWLASPDADTGLTPEEKEELRDRWPI